MLPSPVVPPTSGPIVSVSVDLDPLSCYFRIHALPGAPPEDVRFAILRQALPRFAELFARHGVRATFFVVGSDLDEDADGRRLLTELASAGHELANHSFTHPYDFTRLPSTRIAEEIDRAHQAIGACSGAPPVGFRAPGYETTSEVIDLLCDRGYRYDSSTFPSVPYYLAKAAVMGLLRATGRPSGSILGSPTVLLAPRTPYRPAPGAAYRRGDRPIVQMPMAVTRRLRLPVIGTSLITFPEWLRRHMVDHVLAEPFVNLELHGIDLSDADADRLPPALIARQPDLRRTLAHKTEALEATLLQARAVGARFLPLAEAAQAQAASI